MAPYYDDGKGIVIYNGDAREVVPQLERFDLAVADPPYGETSLKWDKWPKAWPQCVLGKAPQLWCFGSLRMFFRERDDFQGWALAQDVVWEKHNGSNSAADRFRRVHELAVHFYTGEWAAIYKSPVFTQDAIKKTIRRKARVAHWGDIGAATYRSEDGGERRMRSVIPVRSCHGTALHPTQKPLGIIHPLLQYSTPTGGIVLDLFSGSGSTLVSAKDLGLRATGIEVDERNCEIAAKRLSQEVFQLT